MSEQVPPVMYCVTLELEVMNQASDPHPVFFPQSNGSVAIVEHNQTLSNNFIVGNVLFIFYNHLLPSTRMRDVDGLSPFFRCAEMMGEKRDSSIRVNNL